MLMVNKTVFGIPLRVLQLKTSERQQRNYGHGKAQRSTFDSSSWMKTHLSRALKCHFSGLTRISLWSCPGFANSVCVLNADTILPCSALCSYFLVLQLLDLQMLLMKSNCFPTVMKGVLHQCSLKNDLLSIIYKFGNDWGFFSPSVHGSLPLFSILC